jgi:tetratricopeptide (TPR) repeat protein
LLAAVFLAGLFVRVLYTWTQAAVDPWFAEAVLDGRYYLDWAIALAEGRPGPGGAYYLAPLYPFVLAVWIKWFGNGFTLLYVGQHLLTLASAALIALGGRRVLGAAGALAASVLFVTHQPLLFFAARPLSETLAIFLLIAALAVQWRDRDSRGLASGLLAGLAALARPNLLLVPLCWIGGEIVRRRWRKVLLLGVGVTVMLMPTTLRNWSASGHFVPVSSNGGITAYHGNGPGAHGVYTHPAGFSFDLGRQREEATEQARRRSGLPLDDVEADGWWGRQALATRLSRPLDTVGLLAWRFALVLDNHEHGLDYSPGLDPNPWRLTLRFGGEREVALVPWALLLALAGAGVALGGFRRTGGWPVWSAIAACAATPLLFYVSSRYRLPTAALMTIPAGAGLAALPAWWSRDPGRFARALVVAGVLFAVSLSIPSFELGRLERAEGLSNRSVAHLRSGRLDAAEEDGRRAVTLEADSPRLWFNLGVVLTSGGALDEAREAYGRALELEPEFAEAAEGLASAWCREGRYENAVPLLRRALLTRPDCEGCWNTFVVALYASGEVDKARDAAGEASRAGVQLDPELLARIRGGASERAPGETE